MNDLQDHIYVVMRIANGDTFAPRVFRSLGNAAADIWVDDPDARMNLTESKDPYYRYQSDIAIYHVHRCSIPN